MSTNTETKPKPRTHEYAKGIEDLLPRCRCLWVQKIRNVGKLTAYATQSGIVVFLDFEGGIGWTMLTEYSSNSISEHAGVLKAMIEGDEVYAP